jgi:hypothetical protein
MNAEARFPRRRGWHRLRSGRAWRVVACCCLTWAGAASESTGRVVRVEIAARSSFAAGHSFGAGGPYEKLVGRVFFEVNPSHAANREVVDLALAPTNQHGGVEFSADLFVLAPTDAGRGNGTLLLEINNRGGKAMLNLFNHARGSLDPAALDDAGDGFLFKQGFTLAWLGWQFDVPRREHLMRLHAPVARQGEAPIRGLARCDFLAATNFYSRSLADRDHVPYPVADPEDPANRLTVRDTVLGERRVIPRDGWAFGFLRDGTFTPDNAHVYLRSGFERGRIYEVVYVTRDPVVAGLGFAAVRDFASYVKRDAAAPVRASQTLAFGISQSGRFLRHFLYQGFNADEGGAAAFDAILAHVAGAGRGSFNHRFAQPSRDATPCSSFFYPTDVFPFADLPQRDPDSGRTDGLLSRLTPRTTPKIMYTLSSYEYWGRAGSLTHTAVDEGADVGLPDCVRLYLLAGSQHSVRGSFPPRIARDPSAQGRELVNALDASWAMRALLLALHRWARDGTVPPPSRYPKLADGTLTTPDRLAFPRIPGHAPVTGWYAAHRLEFGPEFARGIVSREPPAVGAAYRVLVPQVEADGNEIAGIRMPELSVPLATQTGWNLRAEAIGAPQLLVEFLGSYIPFNLTRAERVARSDPRPSIEERYRSRTEYLERVAQAAQDLVRDGYALAEDKESIVERAARHWELVTKSGAP